MSLTYISLLFDRLALKIKIKLCHVSDNAKVHVLLYSPMAGSSVFFRDFNKTAGLRPI